MKKVVFSSKNTKNGLFHNKTPEKIPLKPYTDFSVIYYIKWSVVAIISVKPMHFVNPMSVKVMHHCTNILTVQLSSPFTVFSKWKVLMSQISEDEIISSPFG